MVNSNTIVVDSLYVDLEHNMIRSTYSCYYEQDGEFRESSLRPFLKSFMSSVLSGRIKMDISKVCAKKQLLW